MKISNTKAKKIKKLISAYKEVEEQIEIVHGQNEMRYLHRYDGDDLDSVVEQLSSEEGKNDFDINQSIGKSGLTLLHISTLISDKDSTELLLGLGAKTGARSYTAKNKGDYITPITNAIVNYKKQDSSDKVNEFQIVKSVLKHSEPEDLVLDDKSNLNVYHLSANMNCSEEVVKLTRNILKERGFDEHEKKLATSRASFSGGYFSPIDFYIFNNNTEAMEEFLDGRSGKEKLEIFDSSHTGMMIKKVDFATTPKYVFPDATDKTVEYYQSQYSGAVAQSQVEEAQSKLAQMLHQII